MLGVLDNLLTPLRGRGMVGSQPTPVLPPFYFARYLWVLDDLLTLHCGRGMGDRGGGEEEDHSRVWTDPVWSSGVHWYSTLPG